MSGLVGPNGAPVQSKAPETKNFPIGGVQLEAFTDPEVVAAIQIEVPPAVAAAGQAAVNEWLGDHQMLVKTTQMVNAYNRYIHALVRECTWLRKRLDEKAAAYETALSAQARRIEKLEASANTTELREPPLAMEDA